MVELLIVIGIFSLIIGISTSSYNNFKQHSNIKVATNGLVEALRYASSSAQSGKGDSKWGVKIISNDIVIFKGNNYSTRDVSYDDKLGIGGVNVTGLDEIVFEKVTGETLTPGNIIFTNSNESISININEKGTIIY